MLSLGNRFHPRHQEILKPLSGGFFFSLDSLLGSLVVAYVAQPVKDPNDPWVTAALYFRFDR